MRSCLTPLLPYSLTPWFDADSEENPRSKWSDTGRKKSFKAMTWPGQAEPKIHRPFRPGCYGGGAIRPPDEAYVPSLMTGLCGGRKDYNLFVFRSLQRLAAAVYLGAFYQPQEMT